MPKSKIEAEFVKIAKIDPDEYEKRQDFLVAVVEKVNTFKDAQWDKLSEAAQDWVNAAIKKVKAKKRVAEFDDVGSVPEDDDKPAKKGKSKVADEDEDEDEEDEAPKKKKKVKAEEDDEEEADDDESEDDESEDEDEEDEPAPKKKKKAKAAEEDDEDEDEDEKPAKKKKRKPADEDEEEDEDEKPKKKKPPAADEDEDEEDDKPAKKKKADKVEAKPTGVKVAIKTAIIDDPEITVDALIKKLGKGGAPVSKVTVSNVRAEFRHTLKVLKELGKLKGVDF